MFLSCIYIYFTLNPFAPFYVCIRFSSEKQDRNCLFLTTVNTSLKGLYSKLISRCFINTKNYECVYFSLKIEFQHLNHIVEK